MIKRVEIKREGVPVTLLFFDDGVSGVRVDGVETRYVWNFPLRAISDPPWRWRQKAALEHLIQKAVRPRRHARFSSLLESYEEPK